MDLWLLLLPIVWLVEMLGTVGMVGMVWVSQAQASHPA